MTSKDAGAPTTHPKQEVVVSEGPPFVFTIKVLPDTTAASPGERKGEKYVAVDLQGALAISLAARMHECVGDMRAWQEPAVTRSVSDSADGTAICIAVTSRPARDLFDEMCAETGADRCRTVGDLIEKGLTILDEAGPPGQPGSK